VTETLRKKFEAFENWLWRRILKITWTEKITTEEVLKRIGVEK